MEYSIFSHRRVKQVEYNSNSDTTNKLFKSMYKRKNNDKSCNSPVVPVLWYLPVVPPVASPDHRSSPLVVRNGTPLPPSCPPGSQTDVSCRYAGWPGRMVTNHNFTIHIERTGVTCLSCTNPSICCNKTLTQKEITITQTPVSGSCCLPLGALQSMWATWCKI